MMAIASCWRGRHVNELLPLFVGQHRGRRTNGPNERQPPIGPQALDFPHELFDVADVQLIRAGQRPKPLKFARDEPVAGRSLGTGDRSPRFSWNQRIAASRGTAACDRASRATRPASSCWAP